MVHFSMEEEFSDGLDVSHLPHVSMEHESIFAAAGKHFSHLGGFA